MKKYLLEILFTLLLISCSAKKEEVKSGIIFANMDTTVVPGDDFTSYVNGTWVKNTEIPADKASYGVGRIVADKAQEDVKKIIEEASSTKSVAGTDKQKVGDLYNSYMDMNKRNSIGLAPLVAEFDKIDEISNYDDLASYFGYATIYGYGTPMALWIEADMQSPDKYALYNYQSGLGLPDKEYYFNKDEKSVELRNKYIAHIEKMFELAELPNPAKSAKTIMKLETKIAKNHLEKEKTRDITAMYNNYPLADVKKLTPKFNWDNFLAGVGISNLNYIIITQVDYTKSLNDIIPNTPLDNWKTYLKWNVLNASASQLTEALDKQNFEFYGKAMSGAQEQQPLWRRGTSVVSKNLGEVIGKVYVKKHFPPEAKERMLKLVQNLLKAYEVSIKDLDWMSEATKTKALEKLSKFTPKIGYPDKWKDYSELTIEEGNLFGNLKRSALVEHKRDIAKIGKPINKYEWGMTPQTVNAYYNPTMNEVVFPAAILQPPFFDMSCDDAINYGAIGAVIGHEIGHGFDDQGSKFDGTGALNNWWTKEDEEEFTKRTSALVNQYSSFKVFDDLNVNGEFTLGENIGDLGGLSISMKAYKMSLNGKKSSVMDGFTGEQRVFLGWGQVWCKKSREEALRRQVQTDPHSPARFRVNGVVRNVPEFYEAFNVQPENALYLAPEDRVKIW